jgi:hypothetical protein
VPVVRTATDSLGSSESGGSSSQPLHNVISVPGPSNPAPSVPAPSAPTPSAPAPSAPAPSAPAPAGDGGIVVPPRLVDELPPPSDGRGLIGRPPLLGGGLLPAGEKDAPAEDRDGHLPEGGTDDASADNETTDSADKVAADGAEATEDTAEDTAEDAGTETESADSTDGSSADTGSHATSDMAA